MKTKYKSLFFMACTIAAAFVMMSLTNNSPSVTTEMIELEAPTAYKNLVTFQTGDMNVFQTKAVSGNKAQKFRTFVSKKAGRNLTLPKGNEKMSSQGKGDPTAHFKQDLTTGTLSFNKGMKRYLEEGSKRLPTAKSANQFAAKFLTETGLAPKNKAELKMMHSGGLRRSDAGSTKVIDVLRTVTYGRMLGKVPVYGPGSKFVVHVGDNGEIVGANGRWKEIVSNKNNRVSKSAMKTAKDAEMEMQRRLQKDFGKSATTKIKNMSLAYYDGAGSHIQPAYFFEISVRMKKVGESPQISFDYMGILPAMKKTPEQFEILKELPPGAAKNVRQSSLKSDRLKAKARGSID